ncbi:MAG: hypothetical protein GX562_06950 [Coriobacteriaceae bacterium]|nr:hypothetical protein [Coriobacteriaceae bacterium]
MPRIIATTTVRNECDIVESYCRYTLTFCDKLVINDNSSKDNTADIIKQLVDEGLPIVLLNNIPYNLGTKYFINNQLLRIAMEEHHADIVLPIDVDEFLITASGENPRGVIEALDPLVEHQIPWRTFIRTSYTEDNEEFLPDGFAKRRADEVQQFYKTIVSSQMFSENRCTLTAGSHGINYPDGSNRRPIQVTSGLFYAHYPIRNSYQAVQKTALSL